jgi:membrane protease YdiL (CAAX protease family)
MNESVNTENRKPDIVDEELAVTEIIDEEAALNQTDQKVKKQAASEAVSLFIVFMVLARLFGDSEMAQLQFHWVGWNFAAHFLMIFLPIVSVLAAGRPVADLGISKSALSSVTVRKTINVLILILAGTWVVGVLVPGLLGGMRPSFILPPKFFGSTSNLPVQLTNIIGYIITIVFMTVCYGIGTEIFYRGCIQGGLNKAFGKPYSVKGINFGPGLFIATGFFTIGQGLTLYSYMVSEPAMFLPSAVEIIAVIVQGLILGFLYEGTKSIFAPVVFNAAVGILFFGVEFVK